MPPGNETSQFTAKDAIKEITSLETRAASILKINSISDKDGRYFKLKSILVGALLAIEVSKGFVNIGGVPKGEYLSLSIAEAKTILSMSELSQKYKKSKSFLIKGVDYVDGINRGTLANNFHPNEEMSKRILLYAIDQIARGRIQEERTAYHKYRTKL
jgi:hypothetical protein